MNNPTTGKKKSNTKKKVFLAVAVLVLLGAIAYLLVPQPDTHKSLFDTSFNKNDQSITNTPTQSPAIISDSPTPIPVTSDSLTIPAWGVKFTIPTSLRDTSVKYTERKSNDQPPVTYYVFTTARIQTQGDKCTMQPFGDTLILNRYLDKPVAVPDGKLVSEQPVGGYYYTVSSPIAYCSGVDANGKLQTPSQIEVRDRESLDELIKSIQAS